MVRKSLLAATLILVATPLAAQEQTVWNPNRPDGHAPLGIRADRTLGAGQFQVTYRFAEVKSKGVWFDNDSLDLETTLEFYQVAPLSMDNLLHGISLAYGITPDITVMASLDYSQRERQQLTDDGIFYVTDSDGLGDLELSGLYRFFNDGPYRAHVEAGVIVPTGDFDARAPTPFSSPDDEALPYDMRPGGGVWGFMPGATAQAQNEHGTVGGQIRAAMFFGTNDLGYTPGSRTEATGWGSYRLNDYFSISARGRYVSWSGIEGQDPDLDPARDPGNENFFAQGSRLDIPVGLNFYLPAGSRFAGHRVAIEYIYPAHHSFEGPQMGLDHALVVGWQLVF